MRNRNLEMTQITMDIERKARSKATAERLRDRVTRWYERQGFTVLPEIAELIQIIAWYFAGCDEFELCEEGKNNGWRQGLGICLSGPTGSSKSTVFEAFQWALIQERSDFTFSTVEVRNVGLQFLKAEKAKTGSGGRDVIDAIGAKDTYYDELGHPNSVIVSYGLTYKLDDLIIDHFDGKPRKTGRLFHTSTNKTKEELKQLLDGRNYSRLLLLCNFIEIETSVDVRTLSKPKRRDAMTEEALERAQREAQMQETERIRAENKLLGDFIAEAKIYYETGTYHISHEITIYQTLMDLGHIIARPDEVSHIMWMEQALTAARETAAARRFEALGDRNRVSSINQILQQLEVGVARTSEVNALITVEYKKLRLRAFVEQFEGFEGLYKAMTG